MFVPCKHKACPHLKPSSREYLRGKYHCTIDLLLDWFGISCMTTDNFCFYLQNRLIQTSQTGGQWYSDTSPLVFPGQTYVMIITIKLMFCHSLQYHMYCSNFLKLRQSKQSNGTKHFKKLKQLFEYQHLLLLRDIWWSKF